MLGTRIKLTILPLPVTSIVLSNLARPDPAIDDDVEQENASAKDAQVRMVIEQCSLALHPNVKHELGTAAWFSWMRRCTPITGDELGYIKMWNLSRVLHDSASSASVK